MSTSCTRTAVLALLAVLVTCTAARSIEELYKVEVGPDDTAQAALQPETRRLPSRESHEGDSDEDSSKEDMP